MMKNKKFILFILGMLSLLSSEMQVQGRPAPRSRDGAGTNNIVQCLDFCDTSSGPVCGIDASGMLRTFENRCLAKLAYCKEGRFYVEIKEGEC